MGLFLTKTWGTVALFVGGVLGAGLTYGIHFLYKRRLDNNDTENTALFAASILLMNFLFAINGGMFEGFALAANVSQAVIGTAAINTTVMLCVYAYVLERKRFSVLAWMCALGSWITMTFITPTPHIVDPHDPHLQVAVSVGLLWILAQHEYIWRTETYETKPRAFAMSSGVNAGFTATFWKAATAGFMQGFVWRPLLYTGFALIFIIHQSGGINVSLAYGTPGEVTPIYISTYILCVAFSGILVYGDLSSMNAEDDVWFFMALIVNAASGFVLAKSMELKPIEVVNVAATAKTTTSSSSGPATEEEKERIMP